MHLFFCYPNHFSSHPQSWAHNNCLASRQWQHYKQKARYLSIWCQNWAATAYTQKANRTRKTLSNCEDSCDECPTLLIRLPFFGALYSWLCPLYIYISLYRPKYGSFLSLYLSPPPLSPPLSPLQFSTHSLLMFPDKLVILVKEMLPESPEEICTSP